MESVLNTSIVASVAGALIGALFGALSAFFLSEHSRKKQIELEKVQKNKDSIAREGSMLMYIQKYVVNVITQNLMNTDFAKDLQKGIFSSDGTYSFSLNTPSVYAEAVEVSDFINSQLFFHWESLNREVYMQNQAISSVVGYYDWLRRASREHILTENSSNLNQKALVSDNTFIVESMKRILEANEEMYKKCIAIMAYIRCYNEYRETIDIRDSSSILHVRNIADSLREYEPDAVALEEVISRLSKIYDSENMYRTTAKA